MGFFDLFSKLFGQKQPSLSQVSWPDLDFSEERPDSEESSLLKTPRGSSREPIKSNFSTPEWVVRQAFDKVLAQTDIPVPVWDPFFEDLYAAHCEGDPRKEVAAAQKHLLDLSWSWAEFDKWAKTFDARGAYPYMWRQHPALIGTERKQPGLDETLAKVPFGALKDTLLKAGFEGKLPRKKVDIIAILRERVEDEHLVNMLAPALNDLRREYEREKPKARCHILVHTIITTAYRKRDAHQRKGSSYRPKGVNLRAVSGGGCPIEEEFADKFNTGMIRGLPPYFPGDRTCVMMKYPR